MKKNTQKRVIKPIDDDHIIIHPDYNGTGSRLWEGIGNKIQKRLYLCFII